MWDPAVVHDGEADEWDRSAFNNFQWKSKENVTTFILHSFKKSYEKVPGLLLCTKRSRRLQHKSRRFFNGEMLDEKWGCKQSFYLKL